jgi:hypothetical protein
MAIIPSAKYDTSAIGECGICHYLGSTIINEARCTCEITCMSAMEKVTFNRKKTVFTRKFDFHFWKKLVKYYSWGIALYGAVIWTLWKTKLNSMALVCEQTIGKEMRNTWKVLKGGAEEG